MKKIISAIALIFCAAYAQAQNGLENIVVEKYYVSNAADATGSSGLLPAGSVTWRVYADMLPGYKFQALYGVAGHTLLVQTSTTFFNNEDFGSTSPNGISVNNSKKNSVMLDSWFSVGATAAGKMGVLKTEDSDGSIGNTSIPPMLQNADPSAGIAINVQDGMVAGAPESVTFVGIPNTGNGDLGVFDGTSQVGGMFSTSNGSVASLNGSTGPTVANRVLVGQFTTTGVFHFELNIQIGTPTGGVQNYVASNPTAPEISIPSLTGTFGAPNILPTVSITAPANGASYFTGDVVAIAATAADADGTVSGVEFFVDGVSIGTDATAAYTMNWTSTTGSHTLTARATDNTGGQTTSAPVTINVVNNVPPTVSITAPSNGALFTFPAVVAINANAADADGTVSLVEFYVNGVLVGSDATAAYSFNWSSVIGTATLTAKATDNHGAQTTSAPITITIADPNALPYKVLTTSSNCVQNNFCVPVAAMQSVQNIIGYDMQMHYNKTKVSPTGVITVNNALINPGYVNVASSVDTGAGTIDISLYFNSSAPANANFHGIGNLLCVEFTKTAGFNAVDVATFSLNSLQESYFNGVTPQLSDAGTFSTYKDSAFAGSLHFWIDNSPIKYDIANPGQYLITRIYGNNDSCNHQSVANVQPNLTGDFNYNINNGQDIDIEKDIPGATNMQPVINGFDAFLTRKVLINDRSFTPSVFQMIAMDVNADGVISAGDLSQIDQRAVLMIPEFRQAWNYNSAGVSNGSPSKDWLFVDGNRLATDLSYRISASYPANDGIGYSKAHVPVVPFCLQLPIQNYSTCPVITGESYKGVLLGDVNGNYSTVVPNGAFRVSSNEAVVLDLTKAVVNGQYVDVPVSFTSSNDVNALDFALQFNESKLTFNSIVDHTSGAEMLSNFNANDHTLRFTSNSLQKFESGQSVVSVRFEMNGGVISESDFSSTLGYLNGDPVNAKVITAGGLTTTGEASDMIYPNPTNAVLNVVVSEKALVQLLDMEGRQILLQNNVNAGEKLEIGTQDIAQGVYMLRISNDHFVTTKKVIINK